MIANMDEIQALAQEYFDRHDAHALMLIEDQISLATGCHTWGDVLKWQRVKLRLQRLQQVRRSAPALH